MPISTPPPVDPASAAAPRRIRGNGALAHPLPAGMRDLMPVEASRQLAICRAVLESFERFGYEPVSVPPFEYAEVLEHDIGPLDAGQVLRFVEPETGEVVALRPDMTPQIARLVATRLADSPPPVRLCYEGAVVRRRVERARRERQIHQAGFELVGKGGTPGDLEVLSVAASAVRATGLGVFTLDLGHAKVAGSLIAGAAPEARTQIVEALATKDEEETRRRAERAGIRGRELDALLALPGLYGGHEVWARADRVLSGTPAEEPSRELRKLYDATVAAGLWPNVVVDLGETWNFAYYTGMLFQVLAEGPGEAIGSGGRYDSLFDRFGGARPAAGFAIDLGNLVWALDRAGDMGASRAKILVVTEAGDEPFGDAVLSELRRRGVRCAEGDVSTGLRYASAWRYSHYVVASARGSALTSLDTGTTHPMNDSSPREVAEATLALTQRSKSANSEGT
ncbi:MAG TPA: ATP phosphoribosyltransferase regulatory subunit [Polyangiaceae bacterium]|jgi:ATP phosphoribosyltransferase regulatory subunit|nr:ATP phosphoribosyltransferase regulatory subunit [Polyangiaceae bacterium]